jgi:hypothetical protein
MAKRFGGQFSPHEPQTEASHPKPARPHPSERRARWLMIAALPLLLTAFGQNPAGLALNLAAFGCIAAAAFLTREGLRAQLAYDARRNARRPALPRKAIAAMMLAFGLTLGSYTSGHGLTEPLILAGTGLILHLLAFGLDPMRDKGGAGLDPFQRERVERALQEAERHLAAIRTAISKSKDRQLEARVQVFAETAQALFAALQDNPSDLSAVRKYLGVYLKSALDATEKFVAHYSASHDETARTDYEALLQELQSNFADRRKTLIDGGRMELDVEIEVLRDRLSRESAVRPLQGEK